MQDALFIISFIFFPILCIKYMHKIGLNIFTISIPTILICSIFVFAYIGVFPLYFEWDSYRVSLGITDKDIIFKIFLFNCISILGLLIGFNFSKNILKLNINFSTNNISNISKLDFIFLIIVFVFCFIVFLIYLSKIQEIAIFLKFKEIYLGYSTNKIDFIRSNMTNSFSGKYHWYNLFMNNILLVVTLSFFIDLLKNGNKTNSKIKVFLFIISLFLTIFISSMAIEKAPLILLLISLFLAYIIVNNNGRINIKYMISFLIFLILLLTILYYYVYWYQYTFEYNFILHSFKTVLSRIFTGSIQPAYHYLEFFPINHDFLYGRSFPNPQGIFPFQPFNLTEEIMNFAQPENIKSGIVGTMPTIFWAEAYANFGFIGVLIIPFIIGIIIWIVSFLIAKLHNTPIKIALYVWLILHFRKLSESGFSGYIIDFYFIFTVGLFLSFILFYGKISKFLLGEK